MAKFSFDEAEHYQSAGSSKTGFFKLVNDRDTAVVRFLYNNADDIEGYSCHRVEIGDKFRYVNCLRTYRDPIDMCPLCKSGNKSQAKVFIPLYNEDAQQSQVWERGSKFFSQISSVCSRYGRNPIVSQIFEIERNGKPKETSTTYNIYRTDEPADDKRVEDYDMPKILGGIIVDATAEDMEYYLDNGEFPNKDSNDDIPIRRSSRREEGAGEVRRTPARSRRVDEEF